tara:strand:+ start:1128 stop:1310 length:183 start_codon:yes stop_codon:yes gene_type:complete
MMKYNVVFAKSFDIKAESLYEAEELGYDQFAEFLVREIRVPEMQNQMMGEFGCVVEVKEE